MTHEDYVFCHNALYQGHRALWLWLSHTGCSYACRTSPIADSSFAVAGKYELQGSEECLTALFRKWIREPDIDKRKELATDILNLEWVTPYLNL